MHESHAGRLRPQRSVVVPVIPVVAPAAAIVPAAPAPSAVTVAAPAARAPVGIVSVIAAPTAAAAIAAAPPTSVFAIVGRHAARRPSCGAVDPVARCRTGTWAGIGSLAAAGIGIRARGLAAGAATSTAAIDATAAGRRRSPPIRRRGHTRPVRPAAGRSVHRAGARCRRRFPLVRGRVGAAGGRRSIRAVAVVVAHARAGSAPASAARAASGSAPRARTSASPRSRLARLGAAAGPTGTASTSPPATGAAAPRPIRLPKPSTRTALRLPAGTAGSPPGTGRRPSPCRRASPVPPRPRRWCGWPAPPPARRRAGRRSCESRPPG